MQIWIPDYCCIYLEVMQKRKKRASLDAWINWKLICSESVLNSLDNAILLRSLPKINILQTLIIFEHIPNVPYGTMTAERLFWNKSCNNVYTPLPEFILKEPPIFMLLISVWIKKYVCLLKKVLLVCLFLCILYFYSVCQQFIVNN